MEPNDRTKEPASLLQRIAAGDADAVNSCIEAHGPLVWSIARRMCADRTEVEDLVQEIFVRLWRVAERYDPARGSETAFVATIARRRLIDHHRSRKTFVPETEIDDDLVAIDDEGLARIELCDEAERARRALEGLRPEQRRVLTLSVDGGLSQSQIAASLGIPLGTVKSHMRRGLGAVARLLESSRPLGASEVRS